MKEVGRATKYRDPYFVGGFVRRQYPGYFHVVRTNAEGGEWQAPDLSSSDEYYSVILDLAAQHMTQDAVILDIGCGTGRITAGLGLLGARLSLGIDNSPEMVAAARRIVCSSQEDIQFPFRGSKSDVSLGTIRGFSLKNCHFALMEAQQLALADGSTDLIICANVLHRVSRPLDLLAEVGRVLKPGGYVLFTNNYDWQASFTPRKYWITESDMQRYFEGWDCAALIDSIPYTAYLYKRKYIMSLNELRLYSKPLPRRQAITLTR